MMRRASKPLSASGLARQAYSKAVPSAFLVSTSNSPSLANSSMIFISSPAKTPGGRTLRHDSTQSVSAGTESPGGLSQDGFRGVDSLVRISCSKTSAGSWFPSQGTPNKSIAAGDGDVPETLRPTWLGVPNAPKGQVVETRFVPGCGGLSGGPLYKSIASICSISR